MWVGVGCGRPFPQTLNLKEDFVLSENILINKFTLSERGRSFVLLCEAGVMKSWKEQIPYEKTGS